MASRRAPRRVPEGLRRHWAGLVVAVLAFALVAAALVAPGLRVADVRLEDGVVFAINQNAGLLGTVNTQIKDLSSAATIAEQSFSVLQEGRTVVIKGGSSNQIQSFDPATGDFGAAVSLPASGDIVLNGGKIAVISRLNGAVWFGDAAAMMQRDFNKEKAQLDLGESALVTITATGELIGLSLVDSQIVRLVNGARVATSVPMELDPTVGNVQLSAVGNKAVVLDRTKQLVWFEGASKAIEMPMGSRAQLAAPIPSVAHLGGQLGAVVATPTGLVGVTKTSLTSLSGTMAEGAVQAPVSANGCLYGVVGTNVATSCPNASPVVAEIPDLPALAQLSLRVNGDNVILNDAQSGDVWLVTDGMRRIHDWTKVTPTEATSKAENPDDETRKVNPNRTAANRPPVANDDSVYARAGRSTVLPILDNDSDPDGDVLTVTAAPAATDGVTLQLVRGGAGLQAVVDAGAKGQRTFSYTITDGRGGYSKAATVSLTIESADQGSVNQPPVLHSKETLTVASGQKTQIRELLRWRDPDGDDLMLVGARLAQGYDEVSFTPDGTITFTDVGRAIGIKQIEVTVSDGSARTTAMLVLDARKPQDVAPVANGDFATATTDQEIEVSPLDNDQGVNLALAAVDPPAPAGAKFSVDYAAKTFRFKASTPGSYYVGYTVTNGRTSFGLVRIDVTDRATTNRPPVTTRDQVLLTHGGSVTLDPLVNDEDPDGDVLVIQTFSPSGLNVTMRDRHLLTISETTAKPGPTTITYWVSDGYNAAVPGTIVVTPSEPVGEVRPVAVADDVNVRVGDAVSLNPMDNDYSPVGLDLVLDTKLTDNPGNAWVDGDKVRFVAPAVPGRVTATYQVKDSIGRTASALIRFNVISPDIVNQPPNPGLVTGRVLAGTSQRIQIPLQNIDPNGDSVRLLGLGSGPHLGRVLSVGPTYLEYQAFPKSAGTDSFTYSVIDAYGAKATGVIRVGVVPASITNTPPTAIQDVVTTRPGRTVYIQPLVNDSDPDGDKISLAAKDAVTFDLPFEIVDVAAIQVTVPNQAGTWFGTYTIEDSRGTRSTGNIVITADPEAKLLAPKAFDDLVDAREVFQRDIVDVPVLANDFDPDGLRSDLTVSVPAYDTGGGPAAVAERTADGWQVRVPIGARMKVIRYTITDADGLTSSAFVTVPGRSDATPWLKDPNVEIEITAGELRHIPVSQYVSGTQGRNVIVGLADKVVGAPGTGLRDSASELTYRPGLNDEGPAAITFDVVEDVDPSVTDARSATLTIRIKVIARAETKQEKKDNNNGEQLNQPPYAPSNIELRVGQGEAPTQQNLQGLLVDREGDAIIVGGVEGKLPDGMSVRMEGSNIFAGAQVQVAKGTSAVVQVKVSDVLGAEAVIPVTLLVVASTRPLTVALEDTADANQGVPLSGSVTANDKSSLDDPSLTVVSVVVETPGSGEARVGDASTVVATPDKAFVGTMVIRYTVEDATRDPDRRVDGRIVLNVRGKPSPPGTPVNTGVGDGFVSFEFSSPLQTGGVPVLRYNVLATGNNGTTVSDTCETTTCTLRNLTNGVEYTLKVAAVNEVNPSDWSPDSAAMMPNVKPDVPSAPTVTRAPGRDGSKLVITWTAPPNRGTPITAYDVKMESGEVRSTNGTTLQLEWPGLTNGTEYSFSVQAINAASPSGFSDLGHGHPSAPTTAPTTVVAGDGGARDGGTLNVTWKAPTSLNGDAVQRYEINWSKTNSFAYTDTAQAIVAGDTLAYTISGVDNNVNYYVSIRAVNAGGSSDPGVSNAAVAYPMPILDKTIVPSVVAGDRVIHVHMDKAVPPNGATIVAWIFTAYRVSGGGRIAMADTGVAVNADGSVDYDLVIPAQYPQTFGTSWTVTGIPLAQSGNGRIKQGEESNPSVQVTPHGNPLPPTLTANAQQGVMPMADGTMRVKIQYEVTPGSANGNDPSRISYVVRSPDGTVVPVTGNYVVVPVPYGGGAVTAVEVAGDSGLSSTQTVVNTGKVIWIDLATRTYHVAMTSDAQLVCSVSSTGAPVSGSATGTANGRLTDYTFGFNGITWIKGLTITARCGPTMASIDTYTTTITIP